MGRPSSNQFYFASKNEEYPPKWEYVVVFSKEFVGGKLTDVPVIAQVGSKEILVSEARTKSADIEALRKIVIAEIAEGASPTWGQARILGFLSEPDGQILQPRRAVNPGNLAYIAPQSKVLSRFLLISGSRGPPRWPAHNESRCARSSFL